MGQGLGQGGWGRDILADQQGSVWHFRAVGCPSVLFLTFVVRRSIIENANENQKRWKYGNRQRAAITTFPPHDDYGHFYFAEIRTFELCSNIITTRQR